MFDLFGILIFLAIFLAIVAVVGHVLWLMAAAFFRAISGTPPQEKLASRPAPRASVETRLREDFVAAKRLLQYAKYRTWLSQDKVQELDQLLDDLQARSRGATAPKPAAAPTQVAPKPSTESSIPSVVETIRAEREKSSTTSLPGPRFDREPVQPTAPPVVPPPVTPEVMPPQPPVAQPVSVVAELPLSQDQHALDQEYRERLARLAGHKRLTADVIYAFMQKANVRWIELISAALIVVCSTGLVISLWSTLAETSRFFPALIFCIATIAIHAAGHYTLKQWKLRNTSRGILHIANMLIPLSVMAGLLLSWRPNQQFSVEVFSVIAIVLGAAVYSSLIVWTSRTLFAARHWFVSGTMIAACVSLLVTHILWGYQYRSWIGDVFNFGGLLVCNAMTAAVFTRLLGQRAEHQRSTSQRMQRMSYQVLFATIAAMGFYAFRNRTGLLQHNGFWLSTYLIVSVWMIYGACAVLVFVRQRGHRTDGVAESSRQFVSKEKGLNFQLYTLISCAFATFCVPVLLLALWQISDDRILLTIALGAITVWLFYLLQRTAFPVSKLAIAIGTCATATIVIEGLINRDRMLHAQDWLELPKVLALIISGTAALVASMRLPLSWKKPTAQAGTIHLVIATLLSSITAVLQILGIRNFAVWPEVVMGTLGLAFLIAANVRDVMYSRSDANTRAKHAGTTLVLASLGMAFFSAFVFHIVQVNPFVGTWLATMRPVHSIATALGCISTTSSLMLLIRQIVPSWRIKSETMGFSDREVLAMPVLLQIFATATAIGCAIQAWIPEDTFHRILTVGWTLPFSLFVLSLIKRQFDTNEVLRFIFTVWLGLAVFDVGHIYHWWQSWDPAYSSVVFFGFLVIPLTLLYGLDRWLSKDEGVFPSLPTSELMAMLGCGTIGFHVLVRSSRQLLAALNQGAEPPPIPETWSEILVLVLGSLAICVTPMIAYAIQGRQRPRTEATAMVGGLLTLISLLLGCWLVPAPYNLLTLLWLSLPVALVYFLPLVTSEEGFWARLKLTLKNAQVVGALGGLLVLAISLTMSFAACTGTLRLPLIAPAQVDDTVLASLARWLPTLSWTLPLQILLAAHWLVSGTVEKHSPFKPHFGWAWMSALAIWTAFTFLFLANISQFQDSRFLYQYGRLLIATFSSLLLIGIAIGRYRSVPEDESSPGLPSGLLNEALWAMTAGIGLSLVTFAVEYWVTLLNDIRVTTFPEFASRTAIVAVTLQMIAIGSIALRLKQLEVWRRMLFVVPMLSTPILLSLAWQWPPLANILNQQLGWLDVRAIGIVVLSGLFAHAVVTYIYLPLARLDYAKLCEQLGQQWAVNFLVLRLIAYALLIGAAFVSSVMFNEQWQVAIGTGLLSLTFLLWSFISAKTRWGVASAVTAIFSGLAVSQLRGYSDPAQLYFSGTTAPLIVAWVSIALGEVHTLLVRMWDVRRPGIGERYGNNRLRVFSIELLVAYGMPVLLGATAIAITRFHGAYTPSGVVFHSICLTIASYLLVIALWLRRPDINLLQLCYFAAMPMFALPLIWFAHQEDLNHRFQTLFAVLGIAFSVLFNSTMFRLITNVITVRLPELWREKLAILQDPASSIWIHAVTTFVTIGLSIITLIIVLVSSETQLRSIAVLVPMLCATSIGVLPFKPQSNPEHYVLQQSRVALLSFVTLACMLLAIRDLGFGDSIDSMDGVAHVRRWFIASAALVWLYVFTASRRLFSDAWTYYLYTFGWLNFSFGLSLGLMMLAVRMFKADHAVDQSVLEEVFVFAAWFALIYRGLRFATSPFANESDQSILQRTIAVYAIQGLLLATGTELYFDHPELFGTWLAAWWPVIVFVISLASIALGTMTRLDQSAIFGGPTRQLNLVMPLVPLLGVWLNSQNQFWQDIQVFGGLMLGAAILYGVQSWVYRSAIMQLVSIACGIISFWCFIFEFEWARIWQHPQLWLLPPAIVALYLIETNRRLFSRSVLTAMRYVVILIAYLSSTADLLLMAFSGSFWMPIILMALSIAGFLSGMIFRISALLICSVVFIFVALVGMVWHAQQAIHHTGPWWVFGIASGTALIFALGYFEKNRAKVNDYLQKLKAWDTADDQ